MAVLGGSSRSSSTFLTDSLSGTEFTSSEGWRQTALSRQQKGETPAGVKHYIGECNRLGVIPVSYFMRHLNEKTFSMRYHGLGPLGAKAISRPLEINTVIEQLDLTGNCIGARGAIYIARVLRENLFITDVYLAENNLESLGAAAIVEMLRENATVKLLDLSDNGLRDSDGRIFYYLMKHNSSLTTLYLRHNSFEVNIGEWLHKGLLINKSLRILDFSWNHLRLQGAVAIATAVKENCALRELHLSMNGFGREGALAMADALQTNTTLEVLDISSNRIPSEGAFEISKALEVNTVLKTLRVGKNPISPAGAFTLISALDNNDTSAITLLHMECIVVDEDFEELQGKLQSHRPLTVVHGGVIRSKRQEITFLDLEAAFLKDPMTKLRMYCREKCLRLIDLFRQFDKDCTWTVTRQEIINGIRSVEIDMDEEETSALLDKLDHNGDGTINYKELMEGDDENKKEKRKVAKWKQDIAAQIKEQHIVIS